MATLKTIPKRDSFPKTFADDGGDGPAIRPLTPANRLSGESNRLAASC